MIIKTLSYAALAERLKCTLEAARSLVTGEVATLKERIESLQVELANLEATAARHWADYERERDRADRLVTELLKATANTTMELAAKLEAEIGALRFAADHGGDGCALSGHARRTLARPELRSDVGAREQRRGHLDAECLRDGNLRGPKQRQRLLLGAEDELGAGV